MRRRRRQGGASVEDLPSATVLRATGPNKETHTVNHATGSPGCWRVPSTGLPLQAVKKPAAVSHEEAAGVALVGLCTSRAAPSKMTMGKCILVLVRGGGAWPASLPSRRCHCLSTASPRTTRSVQLTGADKIVNYREVDWSEEEELKQMDAVRGDGRKEALRKPRRSPEDGVHIIANFEVGVDPWDILLRSASVCC